jgi:hypothetical protein
MKRGSTFFKLAAFFTLLNITFLFIEIRTVTRNEADELNSTLLVLLAMSASFIALGMMYFAKFYKIIEVKKVQENLSKRKLNYIIPITKDEKTNQQNIH